MIGYSIDYFVGRWDSEAAIKSKIFNFLSVIDSDGLVTVWDDIAVVAILKIFYLVCLAASICRKIYTVYNLFMYKNWLFTFLAPYSDNSLQEKEDDHLLVTRIFLRILDSTLSVVDFALEVFAVPYILIKEGVVATTGSIICSCTASPRKKSDRLPMPRGEGVGDDKKNIGQDGNQAH